MFTGEKAWNTAQSLWQQSAVGQAVQLDVIDWLVKEMNNLLLVPAPG